MNGRVDVADGGLLCGMADGGWRDGWEYKDY